MWHYDFDLFHLVNAFFLVCICSVVLTGSLDANTGVKIGIYHCNIMTYIVNKCNLVSSSLCCVFF